MKTKLYLYTFLAVALVVFILGYIGKDTALKYMQSKYINIQLDVNKRQAETMARFLEQRLDAGTAKDSVLTMFQNSINGQNPEKGFMCMFDTLESQLICHPKEEMVGMILPEAMKFDINAGGDVQNTVDVIKNGVAAGGLFHTDKATDIAYMTPVKGTSWMLASHENIAALKVEIAEQRRLFFWGFLALSIVTALLATFMARTVGRRYERTIEDQNTKLAHNNVELKQQKEEILAQNEEIQRSNEYISSQKDEIEHQNHQIVSSIRYAGRIQTALLPQNQLLSSVFSEHFVFYKPRDIVSGDFYWFKKIGDTAVFVAADSTGHGVPGAMMSMLGIAFLNEIVSEETLNPENSTAASVLNNLRTRIKHSLKSSKEQRESVKDGMDLALIFIDLKTKELQFAGAYNPLFIIRAGELTEVQADKMPVGTHSLDDSDFSNKRIQLEKGDALYLFSDGFADQFGGEKGRKFLKKRFKEMLLDVSTAPMAGQKMMLEQRFEAWKGTIDQVDDVLVAGIRI